jgi:hypothetical protein
MNGLAMVRGGLGLMLLALLATTGCQQTRLAMDYQIKVDREFDVEHVKETETFRSGEKFRLRVTTHHDGYVYIFNKGTSGEYNVLYPRPEVNDGSAFVPGWQHVMVPARGAFQLDVQDGLETVVICASEKAVPELDWIVSGELSDPTEVDQLLHELEVKGRRGGGMTKIHHPDHTQVVLQSPKGDAVMVNTIHLEHRQQEGS